MRDGLPLGSYAHLLNGNLLTVGANRPGTPVSGTAPITGRGLQADASTWFETAPVADWVATGPQNNLPWTCVAVCYPDGIGTDVGRVVAGNTASGSEKGWFLGYENRAAAGSPNKARFFVGATSTRVDTNFGKTLSPGERMVVAVGCDANGVYVFCNGTGGLATWSVGATTGNATRTVHIGRPNFSSTVIPFSGLIECIAFIPKKFDLSWYKQASVDPYAMLFEPRRILVSVPVAASAPTLSALSAINVTASSAQPRITYTF